MSLYHKRVFLKQKNSALASLYNNNSNQKQQRSSKSIDKGYSQQALSKLSSTNSIYNYNTHHDKNEFFQPSTQKSANHSKLTIKVLSLLHTIGSYFYYIKQVTFFQLITLANNQLCMIFMSILTIWTIFAIDIDKGFFNVQASKYFSSVQCVAIGLFLIQLIILSLTRQQYFLGFYFWVDCLSTGSMFLQLIWIENLMSGSTDVTVALSFAKLTKASRLSKIGARASKIMRLIRLMKFVKLFREQEEKKDKNTIELQQKELQGSEENVINKKKKNKVGQQGNANFNDNDENTHNQNQSEISSSGRHNAHNSHNHINDKSKSSDHQNLISNYHQEDVIQQSQSEDSQSSSSSSSSSSSKSKSEQLSSQIQTKYRINQDIRQTQGNPLMTFKPIIQRKRHNYHLPFQNLHPQISPQLIKNKQTQQEDSFIKSNPNYPQQQQQSQVNIQNDDQHQQNTNSINGDRDYFLSNNQNIQNQQKKQQDCQVQSKFTLPPLPQSPINNTNLNVFPNSLNISDTYQPSQTQMESHQQMSQEGKSNIEEIMKIFFAQHMTHFIEKGKEINQSNQKQHRFFIKPKISLQEEVRQIDKNKKMKFKNKEIINSNNKNQNKKNKKKRNKSKSKEKKQKSSVNKLKQLQKTPYIKQPEKLKNSKPSSLKKINNNNSNNNTQLIKTITNSKKLSKPQLLRQQLNGSNDKNNKLTNSIRYSFLKRKDSPEGLKSKQLKQKFHRSHNVKLTTMEVPFANIVQKMEREMRFVPLTRHNVDPVKQAEIQQRYDELIERTKLQNEPKKVLNSQNLKVGQVLKQQIQKNIVVMVMGLVMILPMISASTWFDFDPSLSSNAHLFVNNIWQLPNTQAQNQLLQSFIQTGLTMNTPLQYFLLPVNSTCCQFPRQFPNYTNIIDYSYLRLSQQMVIIDGNITIIFSRKSSSQINSYLNLGRSLFITILLIFCSIIFMKGIQTHAIAPLQKMSSLINKISNNPFQALRQINQQKNSTPRESQVWSNHSLMLVDYVQSSQEQELQTNLLSNVIIKITSLLTVGAGEIGAEIISRNIESVGKEVGIMGIESNNMNNNNILGNMNTNNALGQCLLGVYVYIELRGFELMCDIFGDQIFRYMNKVCEIVHLSCIEMGGIPIEYDGKGFFLLFKTDSVVQRVVLSQSKSTNKQKISKKSDHSKGQSGDNKSRSRKNSNDNKSNNHSSHTNSKHNQKHHNSTHQQHSKNPLYSENKSKSIHRSVSQSSIQQSLSKTKNEQSQDNVLCNLSVLAISAMTRIILQINQLQQSRKLYQCILQRYPSSNINTNRNSHTHSHHSYNHKSNKNLNNNNHFNNNNLHYNNQQPGEMFPQNYEPHLVNASVHVGECIYGSLGSNYKLQCKCIGYDIAYARHICHMITQQSYGVSNIISQDIHSLLSQSQYLTQKLKMRQIDHVNIKELRQKDYKNNPDLHFITANKLASLKTQKQAVTKLYTCDFYAKLETYNANESQLINNYGHSLLDFKLNKSGVTSLYTPSSHSYGHNKRPTNNLNNSKSYSIPGNLHSLHTIDEMSEHCLLAYQQREKWLSLSFKDDPILLLSKLESQYPQLKQSKVIYDVEFYSVWNDALQSFYNEELQDSLTQFKFLHTFNQPYCDGPSRVFIDRIQHININKLNTNNNISNLHSQIKSQHNLHQHDTQNSLLENKELPFGVRNVVWKL